MSVIPRIVYFITCDKHYRNILLLKKNVSFTLVDIITDVKDLAENYEDVNLFSKQYHFPEFNLFVMFMAYPSVMRLRMQEYCALNQISCIAIEEVYQQILTNGRVNHYFSPLDAIACPCEREKYLMEACKSSITDTYSVGWPFFDSVTNSPKKIIEKRSLLVFLSPINKIDKVSNECLTTRKKIFKFLNEFQSLGFMITVKLHPMENESHFLSSLPLEINTCNLKVITGTKNISDLLNDHDIIINRGNSNTCIEALFLRKRILIIDLNQESFFSGYPNCISNINRVKDAIDYVYSDSYADFLEKFSCVFFDIEEKKSYENFASLFKSSIIFDSCIHEKKLVYISILYFLLGDNKSCYSLLNKAERTPRIRNLKRFLKFPYSLSLFAKAVNTIDHSDILLRCYFSKIFLERNRYNFLYKFFFKKYISNLLALPNPRSIPYFWGDVHKLSKRYLE